MHPSYQTAGEPVTVDRMTDGRMTFTISNGDRELRFEGELLSEASSYRDGKDRWIEMKLYRTVAGNYVISGCGRTTVPGETDRSWAHVSETPQGAIEQFYLYDSDNVRYLTKTARKVLEDAAKRDDALREAYLIEDVA